MRGTSLPYALAATAALSLGFGYAFWRSAGENDRLFRDNLTAEIALEAAQDEAKILREKLEREVEDRRTSEALQTIAESAEKTAREKLSQEMKTRQIAENGRSKAEAALREMTQKLSRAESARQQTEEQLQAAALRLEERQKSKQTVLQTVLQTGLADKGASREDQSGRQSAVAAPDDGETAAPLLTAKLTEPIAALKSAEASLLDAASEIRAIAKTERTGAGARQLRFCMAMKQNALAVGPLKSAPAATPPPQITASEPLPGDTAFKTAISPSGVRRKSRRGRLALRVHHSLKREQAFQSLASLFSARNF